MKTEVPSKISLSPKEYLQIKTKIVDFRECVFLKIYAVNDLIESVSS